MPRSGPPTNRQLEQRIVALEKRVKALEGKAHDGEQELSIQELRNAAAEGG